MKTTKPGKTISEVFEEFLADQEARISPKTLSKYEGIIQLYEAYLERYWPGHDQERYNQTTDAGGTFCGTFGVDEITEGYSEFLGYFMPRKVMCGKDTMKAAGTVTKKLAKWLVEKGYAKDTSEAQERAGEAARELPMAGDLLDLLEAYLDESIPEDYDDEIEDHFLIKRIEPGKLWLEPMITWNSVIGPVPVPKEITELCQPGWDIGGVVAQTSHGWRFIEVWSVTS